MLLMTAVLRVWVLTSTIALRGRPPRPGNALAGALVCGQGGNPGGRPGIPTVASVPIPGRWWLHELPT